VFGWNQKGFSKVISVVRPLFLSFGEGSRLFLEIISSVLVEYF
jgi:hypothetical protein